MNRAIDADTWAARGIVSQMANIGSEIGRALDAKERGQQKRAAEAAARAYELFDLTLGATSGTPREIEVRLARDEFSRAMAGELKPDELAALRRYYEWFALRFVGSISKR